MLQGFKGGEPCIIWEPDEVDSSLIVDTGGIDLCPIRSARVKKTC